MSDKKPKQAMKPDNLPAAPYEPTPAEKALVARHLTARGNNETKLPRLTFKVHPDGSNHIGTDHPDSDVGGHLLMEVLATTHHPFMAGTVESLVTVASEANAVDIEAANYALSLVRGIKPRDELETMLASQMAAIHLATMNAASSLKVSATIPERDSNERMFNKLARTFAAQVEALKRYRSKGEQRVYVERVNVERGGQAIVGNVSHGGGGDGEKSGR